jgi:SAM-dependent methyltransferase
MTSEEAIRRTIERFPFEDYIPATAQTGAYATIGQTALRYLRPGARILDFGCGPCDKTAVLQFLGFECCGYDDLQDDWHKTPENREKILAFARECGIDFKVADGSLPFEKQSFDMIMLADVLEHLHSSPRDLLNDLLELLKTDGLLVVTVPNAVNIRKRIAVVLGKTNMPRYETFYWYPGAWRGHVREYVRDDLLKLAEYLRLDVVELRGCDHILEALPAAARPVYRLVTGLFPGWKDSWLLVARKGKDWSPKKTLSRDEFARVMAGTGAERI